MSFSEHFETDPTGEWTDVGTAPGVIDLESLVSGTVQTGQYVMASWEDPAGAVTIGNGGAPIVVGGLVARASADVLLKLSVTLAPGAFATLSFYRNRSGSDALVGVLLITGSPAIDFPVLAGDIVNGDELRFEFSAVTGSPVGWDVVVTAPELAVGFEYVVPFAMSAGRLGYQANLAAGAAGEQGSHIGLRADLGVLNADASAGSRMTVDDVNVTMTAFGAVATTTAHGIDFAAGGIYWFTADLSANLTTLTGAIWTEQPPLSGGTPAQSFQITGTAIGETLFAAFGAGGVPHYVDGLSDGIILPADSRYDDWFASLQPSMKVGQGPPRTVR